MVTTADTIVDLFLMRIQDYKLDSINNTSGSIVLTNYCEPWLLDAVDAFTYSCQEDLAYTTSSASDVGYFTATLTTEAKNILSRLMELSWLRREISNVLQLSNFVTDRDFKTFSAAQNLKAKQDYFIVKQEEMDKMLSDYQFKNTPWTEWQDGNFSASSITAVSL